MQERYRKTAYYMPDAPPCGDHEHTSVRRQAGEYACAEQQHETESAVLDTGLDGEGPAVRLGDLEGGSDQETDAESKQVMNEHNEEDVLDALEEGVDVADERKDHHNEEEDDAQPLEGLL